MFQKLQQSDTCNQVKSCTKHGRPDQSQRELTVAPAVALTNSFFVMILVMIPKRSLQKAVMILFFSSLDNLHDLLLEAYIIYQKGVDNFEIAQKMLNICK